MTKQEAITAMKRGEKVTHKYFSPDEWITINDYCQIEDESGYRHEQDSFWLDRGEQFDVGWELLEAQSDGENDVLHDVSVAKRTFCPICWQPLEDGIVKNMCVNDECPTNLRQNAL